MGWRPLSVLFWLGLLGSGEALPTGGDPGELLRTQCVLQSADPRDPYGLSHGILALGASHSASDGRLAADVLVTDFLQQGGPKEGTGLSFTRSHPDGRPLEPFPNLHLRHLLVAGLVPGARWTSSWGVVGGGEWMKAAQQGFRHVPESETYWQEAAWTLEVLARTLRPGPHGAIFVHGGGDPVDFDRVMNDALAYLERAQAVLADAKARGLPGVPKRRQGIYAHPCGGLHLVQAVGAWARHPAVKDRWGARFDAQVELLFYRLGSESKQYEAALQQAPEHRLELLAQMVKFYGHWLETAGQLQKDGAHRLTPAEKNEVLRARALLDRAVRELERDGTFDTLASLRRSRPALAQELVADACIATRGLHLLGL